MSVIRGHQACVVFVTFAPGGDLLVTSGYDGTTRLWDVWTERELIRLPGMAHQLSQDGLRLASQTGYDLHVWELAVADEYQSLPGSEKSKTQGLHGTDISPDGEWLLVANNGKYRLWNLLSGGVTTIYGESQVEDAKFHPTGNELFTSGGGGLYRWPIHREARVFRIGPASRINLRERTGKIALDQRGRLLAVSTKPGPRLVRLQETDLAQPADSIVNFDHLNAQSVALSPNGRWLAAGTQHGFGVKVWDTRSRELAATEPLLPDERWTSVTFSPDGRWLVTGAATEYTLWDVGSWTPVREIRKEQSGILLGRAAFAPDAGILAVEVSTGILQLLDPESGRRLARLEAPDSSHILWLSFSPDGTKLVVYMEAGRIAVWDLPKIRRRLKDVHLDWSGDETATGNEPDAESESTTDNKVEVIVDLGELAEQPGDN
jgi:WD40 repeat protein